MKRFLIVLLCLCFLVVACTPQRPPERPHRKVDQVVYAVHVDESFPPRERKLLVEATDRLRDQTSGFIDVRVVFDLDFDSNESLVLHEDDNLILRLDANHLPSGKQSTTVRTLAFTLVYMDDVDLMRQSVSYLVWDRLSDDTVFVHVAMHEMLHMLRIDHVAGSTSVMYPEAPTSGASLCLSKEDAGEICFVHGCDVRRIHVCS